MPDWEVIIDVTVPREVAAFAKWIDRWRDLRKGGCGCCDDIGKIEGPAEAHGELQVELVGSAR